MILCHEVAKHYFLAGLSTRPRGFDPTAGDRSDRGGFDPTSGGSIRLPGGFKGAECGRCVVGDVWRGMCGGRCVAGHVWQETSISIVYNARRALPTTHPNHTKHFVAKCRGEKQQLTHKLAEKFSKQVCENVFLQVRVLLD